MKFIIETDREDYVDEISCMVDRMDEIDTHAMEKNPEKLADRFIDTLFDCGDVFKTIPSHENVITIEDLKKHLISLYRVQVAELFVKEGEKPKDTCTGQLCGICDKFSILRADGELYQYGCAAYDKTIPAVGAVRDVSPKDFRDL